MRPEVDPGILVRLAGEARRNAYAPYSRFAVGAALLAVSGGIYTGCNVENVSFGLTVCAERNAVFSAICDGEREFVAIAVVTDTGVTPCGACRQVLAEFGRDLRVLVARSGAEPDYRTYTLAELIPHSFDSLT